MRVLYVNLCLLAVVVCASAWRHDEHHKDGAALKDHEEMKNLDGDMPEKPVKRSTDKIEDLPKDEDHKEDKVKRSAQMTSLPSSVEGRRRRSPQMPNFPGQEHIPGGFGRKRRSPSDDGKHHADEEKLPEARRRRSAHEDHDDNDHKH